MMRMIGSAVALFAVAVLLAPQGALAQKSGSAQPNVMNLEGTYWVGEDGPEEDRAPFSIGGSKAVKTMKFDKGGVLVMFYNGKALSDGTWKQDGGKVYFENNNRYREFQGRLVGNGEKIVGDSTNTPGQKWPTTFYRFSRPD